jgi:hypothetical protein
MLLSKMLVKLLAMVLAIMRCTRNHDDDDSARWHPEHLVSWFSTAAGKNCLTLGLRFYSLFAQPLPHVLPLLVWRV